MWDFDSTDFEAELDLGSRRKPVEWVAVAPPLTARDRQNFAKRNAGNRRSSGRKQGSSAKDSSQEKQGDAASSHKPKQQPKRARRPRYDERPPELASGVHGRIAEAVLLEPESDEGNVEYKLRLKQPNPVRFQQLVTQLKYRLSEGNGECFYVLGVEDDGYPRGLSPQDLEVSLQSLKAMTEAVNAVLQPLKEMPACKGRSYLIVRVHRLCLDELLYTDLRIAVAGSIDSGKSTLVAVLTHGQKGRPLLDNGQGSARMNVLKHKHEIETGRTSSLSHHTLAYDSEAGVLNYAGVAPMMPLEIAAAASKVLRFIDLGGHQKYLKTAIYGMTSLLPNYVLLCICPLVGLTRVTREHLAVALALELPLAVVLTKVDITPPAALEALLEDIQRLLAASSAGCSVVGGAPSGDGGPSGSDWQKHCVLVSSEAQAIAASESLNQAGPRSNPVPIFSLASTTGAGLSLLHSFLSRLKPAYELQCSTASSSASGLAEDGPGGSGLDPDLQTHRVRATASGLGNAVWCSRAAEGSTSLSPKAEFTLSPTAAPDLDAFALREQNVQHFAQSEAGGGGGLPETRQQKLSQEAQRQGPNLRSWLLENGQGIGRKAAGRPGEAPLNAPAHFQVDQTFEVRGVGLVVSGTLVAGEIMLNQQLLLGPSSSGGFTRVTVTSIQRSQVPVKRIRVGQHATLAIHAPSVATAQHSLLTPNLTQASSDPGGRLQPGIDTLMSEHPSAVKRLLVHSSSAKVPDLSRQPFCSSTDRRHDTWREEQLACRGTPSAVPPPKATPAADDQSADSSSEGSQQGDSPRVALVTASSQRLSPEEALAELGALVLDGSGNAAGPASSITMVGTADCQLTEAALESGPLAADDAATQGPAENTEEETGFGDASQPVSVRSDRKGQEGHETAHSGFQAEEQDIQEAQASHEECLPACAENAVHQLITPQSSRKGTVLLDTSMNPQAVWQFEAVMVLLSGFWPPRGLLSGSWPPQGDLEGDASCSDSSLPLRSPSSSLDRLRSPTSRLTRKTSFRSSYAPVIHCGSVRQAARVVSMVEVPLAEKWQISDACQATGCNLAPAIAAAASLLVHSSVCEDALSQTGGACVAIITFCFTHQPEWLLEGSRLVVRDRTESCTAGAGIVRCVLPREHP